ncbi:MAG: hypothetical protein HRU19_21155 [Pseudobacteriovorax sp.]|nr:hypothetical protein [Pseudobacteriovorax sp.]
MKRIFVIYLSIISLSCTYEDSFERSVNIDPNNRLMSFVVKQNSKYIGAKKQDGKWMIKFTASEQFRPASESEIDRYIKPHLKTIKSMDKVTDEIGRVTDDIGKVTKEIDKLSNIIGSSSFSPDTKSKILQLLQSKKSEETALDVLKNINSVPFSSDKQQILIFIANNFPSKKVIGKIIEISDDLPTSSRVEVLRVSSISLLKE